MREEELIFVGMVSNKVLAHLTARSCLCNDLVFM